MDILGKLRDRPRWLETAYRFADAIFTRLDPLLRKVGYSRADS